MDLYELLGEDKNAPEHKLARALRDADDQLFKDLVATRKSQGLTQKQMAQRMDTRQGPHPGRRLPLRVGPHRSSPVYPALLRHGAGHRRPSRGRQSGRTPHLGEHAWSTDHLGLCRARRAPGRQ